MTKEIKIYDYMGVPATVTINNFEKVKEIRMEVLSGDEVLYVDEDIYDSSEGRTIDFFDGDYVVYEKGEINLLEEEEWLSNNNSYERLDIGEKLWIESYEEE